ncbi:MAG TPA: hypothetical protein VEO56_15125 [Bacteroidota bacterium]|nr:hypothetical protein [Bacteroidota bacterium]
MATFRWLLIGCFISVAPLRADDPPTVRPTHAEVRLALLGVTPLGGLDTTVATAVPSGSTQTKKAGLAALYSLLIPGLGELYAGDFSSGKYFLMSEGVLWLTYGVFEIYGNSLRSDARLFAVAYAGVDPAGKNDQFYVDVGNFLSVSDYNDKKLRDRNPNLVYDAAAGYGWLWPSDALRASFRDQRIRSENMFNNTKFVGAAILANHIASAINAARAAIVHNAALSALMGDLQFSAALIGSPTSPSGVKLTVTRGL